MIVNFLATDVPMGGWKESGIGFRHGEYGIKKYCRPESIVVTRFGGKREPTWYPYTKARRGLVAKLAQAVQRPRPEAPARQTAARSTCGAPRRASLDLYEPSRAGRSGPGPLTPQQPAEISGCEVRCYSRTRWR